MQTARPRQASGIGGTAAGATTGLSLSSTVNPEITFLLKILSKLSPTEEVYVLTIDSILRIALPEDAGQRTLDHWMSTLMASPNRNLSNLKGLQTSLKFAMSGRLRLIADELYVGAQAQMIQQMPQPHNFQVPSAQLPIFTPLNPPYVVTPYGNGGQQFDQQFPIGVPEFNSQLPAWSVPFTSDYDVGQQNIPSDAWTIPAPSAPASPQLVKRKSAAVAIRSPNDKTNSAVSTSASTTKPNNIEPEAPKPEAAKSHQTSNDKAFTSIKPTASTSTNSPPPTAAPEDSGGAIYVHCLPGNATYSALRDAFLPFNGTIEDFWQNQDGVHAAVHFDSYAEASLVMDTDHFTIDGKQPEYLSIWDSYVFAPEAAVLKSERLSSTDIASQARIVHVTNLPDAPLFSELGPVFREVGGNIRSLLRDRSGKPHVYIQFHSHAEALLALRAPHPTIHGQQLHLELEHNTCPEANQELFETPYRIPRSDDRGRARRANVQPGTEVDTASSVRAQPTPRVLHASNISHDISLETLKEVFQKRLGTVKARIPGKHGTDHAYVEFPNHVLASSVLEESPIKVQGRKINLEWDYEPLIRVTPGNVESPAAPNSNNPGDETSILHRSTRRPSTSEAQSKEGLLETNKYREVTAESTTTREHHPLSPFQSPAQFQKAAFSSNNRPSLGKDEDMLTFMSQHNSLEKAGDTQTSDGLHEPTSKGETSRSGSQHAKHDNDEAEKRKELRRTDSAVTVQSKALSARNVENESPIGTQDKQFLEMMNSGRVSKFFRRRYGGPSSVESSSQEADGFNPFRGHDGEPSDIALSSRVEPQASTFTSRRAISIPIEQSQHTRPSREDFDFAPVDQPSLDVAHTSASLRSNRADSTTTVADSLMYIITETLPWPVKHVHAALRREFGKNNYILYAKPMGMSKADGQYYVQFDPQILKPVAEMDLQLIGTRSGPGGNGWCAALTRLKTDGVCKICHAMHPKRRCSSLEVVYDVSEQAGAPVLKDTDMNKEGSKMEGYGRDDDGRIAVKAGSEEIAAKTPEVFYQPSYLTNGYEIWHQMRMMKEA